MKYGLECEFFVAKKDVNPFYFVGGLDASLTPDECGFLAEARGQPHPSIREAVFSLMADIFRLEQAADKLGLQLVQLPNANVPDTEILKSRRQFSKGTLQFQNLYGHEGHRQKRKKTAGIHVSFTCPLTFYYDIIDGPNPDEHREKTTKTFTYQPVWDFVQLFRAMDKAFATEIREAQRNPGFYEIKTDGRVEYRSLPNTADLKKIISVIEAANSR